MLNLNCQAPLNSFAFQPMYAHHMGIGARIRQLRQANRLSGDEFGELCGVTKGAVSQWESDLVTPPVDRLMDLHKKLEFSFDWLLNGLDSYATTDPKIIATAKAMEHSPEYVKDAAVQAVLTTCELAKRAKANGNGTDS